MKDIMRDELGVPKIVDRSTFQAELDALRVREKAHTHEKATRSRPLVAASPWSRWIGATPLIGRTRRRDASRDV